MEEIKFVAFSSNVPRRFSSDFLMFSHFLFSQFWVIMSALVRFGYGSVVQSNHPANSIQFVLSEGRSEQARERERREKNKKKSVLWTYVKLNPFHVMHSKPFSCPRFCLTNSKFSDDDENPLWILIMKFWVSTLIICGVAKMLCEDVMHARTCMYNSRWIDFES